MGLTGEYRYGRPTSVEEGELLARLDEKILQALWFEQLFHNPLTDEEGRVFTVVQPGIWNRGAGPDFLHAALRDADGEGELHTGAVEVHWQPPQWQSHGHDADPAYEGTILHVCWDAGPKRFFPATHQRRAIRQVFLKHQLLAPFAEILPHLSRVAAEERPAARPGRCREKLEGLDEAGILAVLRSAGKYRLERKAERMRWRERQVGRHQALWEALAEGLGYAQNKIPFRLVAQRLPWADLKGRSAGQRLARLFGVAGLLPHAVETLPEASRRWVQPVWDAWWSQRGELAHAILPRNQWKLAGLRPWNRPERRLAALHGLVPKLPRLIEAVDAEDSRVFARLLAGVRDAFWERQATCAGTALTSPQALLGSERITDLVVNAFWPMVAMRRPFAAEKGWEEMQVSPNGRATLAVERILPPKVAAHARRQAVVQQGLLQIYQDYCVPDASQCRACRFPELIRGLAEGSAPPADAAD